MHKGEKSAAEVIMTNFMLVVSLIMTHIKFLVDYMVLVFQLLMHCQKNELEEIERKENFIELKW